MFLVTINLKRHIIVVRLKKHFHVNFVKCKVFQQLFCHTATFSTALFVTKLIYQQLFCHTGCHYGAKSSATAVEIRPSVDLCIQLIY